MVFNEMTDNEFKASELRMSPKALLTEAEKTCRI